MVFLGTIIVHLYNTGEINEDCFVSTNFHTVTSVGHWSEVWAVADVSITTSSTVVVQSNTLFLDTGWLATLLLAKVVD
jgi:hypothetical protein